MADDVKPKAPKSVFTTPTLHGSTEVLQALFENGNSPLAGPFLRWKLWKKWSDYVGPTIAAVTEPVGFRKGTLFLWVHNSSWMQQLLFLREQIKKSINEKVGRNQIRTISFTLNRNLVPTDPGEQAELKNWIQKLAQEPPEK